MPKHFKQLPKQVSENISKTIKNHVFLNGKIIQIHLNKIVFEGLAGCVRERKTYQQAHQKLDKILSQLC